MICPMDNPNDGKWSSREGRQGRNGTAGTLAGLFLVRRFGGRIMSILSRTVSGLACRNTFNRSGPFVAVGLDGGANDWAAQLAGLPESECMCPMYTKQTK